MRAGPLLAVALVCTAVAQGRAADLPARPSVLLVTIDTLRADRVGAYGASPGLTPRLDGFARNARVYENATAPMPLTRPSHFSILTGLYPREHGVLNNQTPLPADLPTMAEAFQQAGYRTGAFVAVSLLAPDSGVARGFGTFSAPTDAHGWSADRVVPALSAWLDEVSAGGQPFFAWLHLFDPHMPYEPPAGYRPSTGGVPGIGDVFSWPIARELAAKSGGALSAAVLNRAMQLYDGEVRYTDHWLGETLDALRKRALAEKTLVVVTADHGECFDHGVFFEHSDCLFDGAVHVPLVVRDPGAPKSGERVATPIGHPELAPMILRLAGVPASGRLAAVDGPETNGRGGERFATIEGPSYPAEAQSRRSERQQQIREVAGHPTRAPLGAEAPLALRTRDWKLIATGAKNELYDLRHDPAESRDVAAGQPELTMRLRRDLDSWMAAHPRRVLPQVVPSAELEDALRALGYVP